MFSAATVEGRGHAYTDDGREVEKVYDAEGLR